MIKATLVPTVPPMITVIESDKLFCTMPKALKNKANINIKELLL